MVKESSTKIASTLQQGLQALVDARFTPLDLLPRHDPVEKLIELELNGPPAGLHGRLNADLAGLAELLSRVETFGIKVVVIGGGTGLSNIIGGDSRSEQWPLAPFNGLKALFPRVRSIVCVTDDGGSTGELLKDLPLIALGDLRHVLLSAVQLQPLQEAYGLDSDGAHGLAAQLYRLFNHRFEVRPLSATALLADAAVDLATMPAALAGYLQHLLDQLFVDPRLVLLLDRPHCLGNLLLVAALFCEFGSQSLDDATLDCRIETLIPGPAIMAGLGRLARYLGLEPDGVMPCCTTPARLQMRYGNGVLVTGEYKSSHARRNSPVDRLFVEFGTRPEVPPPVLSCIKEADIILFAPGSLFTSILPVLLVPGVSESIRRNRRAIKLLLANVWAQKGETDVVPDDPARRYHVSDLLKAYERNVPGGVRDLFHHVLTLGLQDIPGSILQNYAVEGKAPMYLDRQQVTAMGYIAIEAGIFSQAALQQRRVVQHDPTAVARVIRTIWALAQCNGIPMVAGFDAPDRGIANNATTKPASSMPMVISHDCRFVCQRFRAMLKRLDAMVVQVDACCGPVLDPSVVKARIADIFWVHGDIPLTHLDRVEGIRLIDRVGWKRCQQWDNVFSFYDPDDRLLKFRQDIFQQPERFEVAFLVALGQALLGTYAAVKEVVPVELQQAVLGKVYYLTLQPTAGRLCYLNDQELDTFLRLARMVPVPEQPLRYARLVNGDEGFTPPGLLFGLIYAWYLDNRFTKHIESKMAVVRHEASDLIPEQIRVRCRRQALIRFYCQVVFGHDNPAYDDLDRHRKIECNKV